MIKHNRCDKINGEELYSISEKKKVPSLVPPLEFSLGLVGNCYKVTMALVFVD
jgi:hypothetical protein